MNDQAEVNDESRAEGQSLLNYGLATCHWCGEGFHADQPTVKDSDGDRMHLSCAAEEDDDAHFDSDMGFGG